MTTTNDSQNPAEGELRFDRAEAETPAKAKCVQCGTELMSSYFQINGNIVCEACRYKIEAAFKGGSGLGRFVKSLVLGTGAGAIGAGLYFGISALTGYEFGLVAIIVGLLVGGAVRVGCNRRGGWRYQALAMFLTYSSIVSTYIPPIYKAVREEAKKQEAAESAAGKAAPADPGAESSPAAAVKDLPPALRHAIGFVLLFALAFVAPFLAGFQNIIGLVIIGIGLYEAWKLNKRAVMQITGPHRLGSAPEAASEAGADAGA
ncbi:MAG: hypothetical protein AB1714_09795 [Acidobacteriota bacterium]